MMLHGTEVKMSKYRIVQCYWHQLTKVSSMNRSTSVAVHVSALCRILNIQKRLYVNEIYCLERH